jgi:hypothetical protein
MEKFATSDEVLAQIRRMSIEDRAYVEAELMRDADESGRIVEPAAVMDEAVRRADEALAHQTAGCLASSRSQAPGRRRRKPADAGREDPRD